MRASVFILIMVLVACPSTFIRAARGEKSTGTPVDLFTVPPLHIQSFQSLGLPPLVNRLQLAKSIQTFADQTFGQAFIDIGDMSDFMHGHILWDPKTHDSKLDRPLAILFHTQEFPNIRPGGYVLKGHVLDPYDRNWISWQEPFRTYKLNDLTPAQLLMPNVDGNVPTTVSSDMLDGAVFGNDVTARSTTIFFYRFSCDELRNKNVATEKVQSSNIIQVRVNAQPVCLALVNEVCNTSKETSADCPGTFEFHPIDHRDP